MTAVRPSRAELRHSILARLSTFTAEVEWANTGAHVAFADSIVDFADWLAGTTEPVPLRGPGASRRAIDDALRACAEAVDPRRHRTETTTDNRGDRP